MSEKYKKAVALRYDPSGDEVPVLVAKGKRALAHEIIRVAKENNIPIVENEPLVEALIKLDLHEQIPPQLYESVAEILAFVMKKLEK